MTNISIVEDLPDVVKGIIDNVSERDGFRIVGDYAYGELALQVVPHDGTDIVLLDLGLAGDMKGIETMIKMLDVNPQLKFLVFTVFEDDKKLFDALRYGASGYILKQDGIPGVLSALRELNRGGAPMSRRIAQRVLSSFRETPDKPTILEKLTGKQNEVLSLLAEGLLNKEIADRMGVKESTVKTHLYAVFKKLHVNNRVEAMKIYLKQ